MKTEQLRPHAGDDSVHVASDLGARTSVIVRRSGARTMRLVTAIVGTLLVVLLITVVASGIATRDAVDEPLRDNASLTYQSIPARDHAAAPRSDGQRQLDAHAAERARTLEYHSIRAQDHAEVGEFDAHGQLDVRTDGRAAPVEQRDSLLNASVRGREG